MVVMIPLVYSICVLLMRPALINADNDHGGGGGGNGIGATGKSDIAGIKVDSGNHIGQEKNGGGGQTGHTTPAQPDSGRGTFAQPDSGRGTSGVHDSGHSTTGVHDSGRSTTGQPNSRSGTTGQPDTGRRTPGASDSGRGTASTLETGQRTTSAHQNGHSTISTPDNGRPTTVTPGSGQRNASTLDNGRQTTSTSTSGRRTTNSPDAGQETTSTPDSGRRTTNTLGGSRTTTSTPGNDQTTTSSTTSDSGRRTTVTVGSSRQTTGTPPPGNGNQITSTSKSDNGKHTAATTTAKPSGVTTTTAIKQGPSQAAKNTTTTPHSPGKLLQELDRFFTSARRAGASGGAGSSYNQVKDVLTQIRLAAAQAAPAHKGVPGGHELNTANPDDESELSKNNLVAKDLFEGDIVLRLDQAKGILGDIQKNGGIINAKLRRKRKVINDLTFRWPGKTLYYTFDDSLDNYKIQIIKAAITAWQDITCVRFQQGTGQGDYVTFFSGSGCYGEVGRSYGQQGISIGDGCEATGIAAHEIAHALGFFHEQNRYDRSTYIRVQYDNIDPEVYGNFMRLSSNIMDDYGVPYDLGSVMHYGGMAFSYSADRLSIRTLDPNYQHTIGQRQSISFIDVKQINRAYCSDVCRNQLACKHEGYADPSGNGQRCNQCRCPGGLGGTLCDTAADSDSGCGGVITATSSWQTVLASSPSRRCNWLLKTDQIGHIILEVVSINLRCRSICRGYLEVKKGPNFSQTGSRFCCRGTWTSQITSAGNEMVVMLRAEPNTDGTWDVQFRFRTDSTQVKDMATGANGGSAGGGAGGGGGGPVMADGSWGQWTAWSQCSVSCGGCGSKERSRQCSSGDCGGGEKSQKQACGDAVCGGGAGTRSAVIDSMCQRTERVPCRRKRAAEVAVTGSRKEEDAISDWRRHPRQRVSRQNQPAGRDCGTKTSQFFCAKTNPNFQRPLTDDEMKANKILSSDWNRSPNGQQRRTEVCCDAFEQKGDRCVPRKPD